MSDYRRTQYCPILENIDKKKVDLANRVKNEHPKVKFIYNQVRKNECSYKKDFMKIYNDKCSYCGVSLKIISKSTFEIDHYIPQGCKEENVDVHSIHNLKLACRMCNNGKLNYISSKKNLKLLDPDLVHITTIFERDKMYYIRITSSKKSDKEILEFYNKLKFDNETRRLDYLVMSMQGLKKVINGRQSIVGYLNEAILLLLEKRNESS